MALGTIPSWLNLPNFVQAMREGAATGLAARRTDIEEQQVADRMALAYEQLAEKERDANQLAQYRMALEEGRQQRAADALNQRTAAALAIHQIRQERNQHAADALKETMRHNLAMESKPSGGGDYITETTTIPGVAAQIGIPAEPGPLAKFGIPWGSKPAIPAVQGTPTRRITKRVRVSPGDALLKTPTSSANEVIRTDKSGRRVVYDANTKQPLRYADTADMGGDDTGDDGSE